MLQSAASCRIKHNTCHKSVVCQRDQEPANHTQEVRFSSILPQSAASCGIKHDMRHKSVVCQCNPTSKPHTRKSDLTVSCHSQRRVAGSGTIRATSQWCVSAIQNQQTAYRKVRLDSVSLRSAACCRIKQEPTTIKPSDLTVSCCNHR